MALFGKRPHKFRSRSGGRLHPLAIVGICLAAAILIAIIVGNLLKLWLNDEKMAALKGTETIPPVNTEASPSPERTAPSVHAYPFTLGNKTDSLTKDGNIPTALSLSLNTESGKLLYSSPVSDYQGIEGNSKVKLSESMNALRQIVPYLSGVFYPQAPLIADENVRYAATSAEIALLREFIREGGSEILLMGLSFDAENLAATVDYIREVRRALADTTLGFSVPLSVSMSADGWELLPSLSELASFMAVDLSAEQPDETGSAVANGCYYVTQYRMRMLLTASQVEFIRMAESLVSDFQIVTVPTEPSETP